MTAPVGSSRRGWLFPPHPLPHNGALALLGEPELLRQSIRLILETEPGERVMRPGFGAGLHRYLMTPSTPGTWSAMARAVETALATWEPRIEVSQVHVGPGDEPSLVLVTVAYTRARDGAAEIVEVALPAPGAGA